MDEREQRERESREEPDTKYEQAREAEEVAREDLAEDVREADLTPQEDAD